MDRAPASTGAARRRVDWRLAARLLGEGLPPAEVAERLGCARSTVVRRLRRDLRLRQALAQAAAPRAVAEDRLAGLRRKLHDAIESEVQSGNVRVILWLADRMKLIQPSGSRTPQDELNELIDGMTTDELGEFEALRDPVARSGPAT